jgi:serine/threonine protein phosphatase 1
MELDRACRLVPLRGNHELMMLEARQEEFDLWYSVGGQETLDSYGSDGSSGWIERIPAEHWRFIEERCLPWLETETHIFAHAGLNPLRDLDKQEEYDLFWQRLIPARPHRSGKTVIFGHIAQHSGLPLDRGYLICIDTWAYGDGWLTCLDVDRRWVWQANQRGQLREGPLEELSVKEPGERGA